MAKGFGFDGPGALTPGTPTRHEVWKALKKKFLMGLFPDQSGIFRSTQTILIAGMES